MTFVVVQLIFAAASVELLCHIPSVNIISKTNNAAADRLINLLTTTTSDTNQNNTFIERIIDR